MRTGATKGYGFMNVRLMQLIDYWMGVPACFLLTIYRAVKEFIFGRPKCASPRKVIFIELSEMGSAVLAYSALASAARTYGRQNVYFLIFKTNRESVDILNVLPDENVITIDSSKFGRFLRSAYLALRRVSALEIDTVIDLELFSRFTMIFSFLCGAVRRIGFHNYTAEGLYRGRLLTDPVYYNPHQHMCLNFVALLRACLGTPENEPRLKENVARETIQLPSFVPDKNLEETSRRILRTNGLTEQALDHKTLVFLNPDPGMALPLRGWPVARYAQVAKSIIAAWSDYYVVITGLADARPYYEAISQEVKSARLIDLTGQTKSLAELLAVFQQGSLLLTNDGGPAHFAALLNISAIALFGPETPRLYSPLGERVKIVYAGLSCSPCLSAANHRHSICCDNKCLQAIEVAEVFSMVRDCIEPRS